MSETKCQDLNEKKLGKRWWPQVLYYTGRLQCLRVVGGEVTTVVRAGARTVEWLSCHEGQQILSYCELWVGLISKWQMGQWHTGPFAGIETFANLRTEFVAAYKYRLLEAGVSLLQRTNPRQGGPKGTVDWKYAGSGASLRHFISPQ